ncbi:MAG: GNAT family N-acetyltransferase [Nannocystaceae bacterium]
MHDVLLRPAVELRLVDLASLFTASFAGYAVPIVVDAEALAGQLRTDGVDLGRSLVALVDGAPAGLLLLAPRGWSARVAGMGVVPGARRRGVGARLLERALDGLRAAGYRELRLEVIADNHAAIELYRAHGLRVRRRLVGYARAPAAPGAGAPAIVEVDPCEVAAAVARHGDAELPWQLRAESLCAQGPPARGWRLEGGAWALTTIGGDGALVILALVVAGDRRRRGLGSAMIDALAARHHGLGLRIPARAPEGLGAAMLAAKGLEIGALTQFEMTRRLDDAPDSLE